MSTGIGPTSAASFDAPWRSTHAAPPVPLEPFTTAELTTLLRGGEVDADVCERVLATSARVRGAIDVAIAKGLDALRHGDRLAQLGCHLDDYGREALDLGRRATQTLARLGRALRTRPILDQALRCGRVRLRAAETILPVAIGDAEAEWAERAARSTVRELEAAVRRARVGDDDDEEDWVALRTHLPPEERVVVDAALDLAGEVMPGSSRAERLEAIAQETLRATAAEIDARLRDLARLRAGWDDLIGFCAATLKKSGVLRLLGFSSLRHYCEDRLGLPGRAVEQRAALEERLWASPALRAARDQGISYEKLRLLAKLPEADVAAWTARAAGLTCIALERALGEDRERQMRARGTLAAPLPRRVAVTVAAAIRALRARAGAPLPAGKCLALMAAHFLATWKGAVPRSRTASRKARDRDSGFCQVPGCSHRATHAHHIAFRSHGGGDESGNLVALGPFHHLRCIHGGWLRVFGRAPDELTWFLGGKIWRGPAWNAAARA